MISPFRSMVLGALLATVWTTSSGSIGRANAEPAKTTPPDQPVAADQPPRPNLAPPAASAPKPAPVAPMAKSKTEPAPTAKVDQPAKLSPPIAQPDQPAVIQAAAEAPATPPRAVASGMPREPSIHETGRVGKMGVSDSGVRIKQTEERPKPKETRIEEKSITPESAFLSSPPSGVLNQATFGRELRPRFALLKDCRIEVARQRRTDTASVPASQLILRWTVLPNGTVTDTQVVATSPLDGRVTDCVKRQMSLWSFSPPSGGAARVERPFKFQ